jgi:hypothetical protein
MLCACAGAVWAVENHRYYTLASLHDATSRVRQVGQYQSTVDCVSASNHGVQVLIETDQHVAALHRAHLT